MCRKLPLLAVLFAKQNVEGNGAGAGASARLGAGIVCHVGAAATAAAAAGKQNKWKMNSIHYHDVKSCVVTARL